MQLAVVGAGYVGLVTAIALAEKGHNIIVVEKDLNKLQKLQNSNLPFFEPGLEEALVNLNHQNRLVFTNKLISTIKRSKIIFIAVGTPPLSSGEADLSSLVSICIDIASSINNYKIIVIKSTVPVGTCDMLRQIIAKNQLKPCNFDVISNPEFLREGSALFDAREPSRIVLGCSSKKSTEIMKKLYQPFKAPIIVTDTRSSEMIKYASNAFLATKISFINEIANICEKVGADIVEVANGMGLDKRIGPDFLRAGIGYGGSCFPKDTKALIQIAGHVAYDFKLLKAVVEVNNLQRKRIIQKLKEVTGGIQNKTIAVWGLSFKPNTDDIREAPSIEITKAIIKGGGKVKAYDPMVNSPRGIYKDVIFCSDPYEAVAGSDAVILVTEWDVFKNIDLIRVKKLMKQPILIDGRNIFNPRQMEANGFKYHCFGRPSKGQRYLPWTFDNVHDIMLRKIKRV